MREHKTTSHLLLSLRTRHPSPAVDNKGQCFEDKWTASREGVMIPQIGDILAALNFRTFGREDGALTLAHYPSLVIANSLQSVPVEAEAKRSPPLSMG